MGVGNRIAAQCAAKGLSIRQLALKADVPYSSLYSAIKRDSNGIDTETIKKIAAALGIPWYELLTDEPNEPADLLSRYLFDDNEDGNIGNELLADSAFYSEVKSAMALKTSLDRDYATLNAEGRKVAVERVHELTEIPRYKRKSTPEE